MGVQFYREPDKYFRIRQVNTRKEAGAEKLKGPEARTQGDEKPEPEAREPEPEAKSQEVRSQSQKLEPRPRKNMISQDNEED